LISSDLVISITVAVQRGEHNAEWTGPLAEQDEEVMTKALLREQEASVVHWDTLDEVGHHGTEVSSDVLEDLRIFVILGFQKHPGKIHILQEQSAQGQGIAFQSSICTVTDDT
jgi:hypothetical protein